MDCPFSTIFNSSHSLIYTLYCFLVPGLHEAMRTSVTSLETLYCLKQFRRADISSGGVFDVEGTLFCGIHAEVDCWTVCISQVSCTVLVVPVGTNPVLATVTFLVAITSTKVVEMKDFNKVKLSQPEKLTSVVESASIWNLAHMIRYVESRDKSCVT